MKDSFATLDLAPHGFRVRFDAQGIVRAGDGIVAGAILNRSARVLGISNFFAVDADLAPAGWLGPAALVTARFPGFPVVGYETGARLAVARASGFGRRSAPVWIRDE